MTTSTAAVAPTPGTTAAQPDGASVVVTRGLSKRYGRDRLAVDGLDLVVPAGAVFGFLGPNGSGKTTTIRMLMGLIKPTSGTATVLGGAMPGAAGAVLPRVGALIEGPAHYGFLTGRENLARLDAADRTADPATRKRRIDEALARVGLSAVGDRKARAYSLGMKQRLGIASALLRPRDLLVLDEPTNGLDPQGMREIRALIRSLAADGTTVFLSSHLLDEIEQVCTHAAIMSRGRLVTQGTVDELRSAVSGRLRVGTPDAGRAAVVLAELGLAHVATTGDGVEADLGDLAAEDVCAALVRRDVRVRSFTTHGDSLEDAFVALTGEGFDVES
ncbi:ABC transporter ATP-binding protein [Uniformispora flossi]|uniref:ABC transporter ATP-binding protein n=1 Tax=Uniformispora flossi TaxID=3390723 RepID=UPI003C2F2143